MELQERKGVVKLESAIRKHLPDLFEEQPDLLHILVSLSIFCSTEFILVGRQLIIYRGYSACFILIFFDIHF
jgi:hypothetical protein